MAGDIPKGWRKTSNYSICRGRFSVCKISVMDVRMWELWDGQECVYRGKAEEGAFSQALDEANKREEKAA